jgi:hypothetical protein
VAAHGGVSGAGHLKVHCEAAAGCRSVWYKPRHEPDTGAADCARIACGLIDLRALDSFSTWEASS